MNTLSKKQIGRLKSVRMTLQKRIESGIYQPDQKIDTVKVLSEELKAGKETVQRALAELEAAVFVTSIPRRGVFVNENFREKKENGPGGLRDAAYLLNKDNKPIYYNT